MTSKFISQLLVLQNLFVQLIFIIHEFCICEFVYLIKFICNSKIYTYIVLLQSFTDMWRVAKNLSRPVRAFPAEVEKAVLCLLVSAVINKTESWHCLPQETDFSQTLDTSQTRFNVREEGAEVTDFPSLEEGILTQSENQVKEHNRDFLCSPLLVIQDSFASPDLPLLTCVTEDQEFGLDSLFHQSELDFAPLRAVPDRSEDTEWFSRPSEVSEALFQATSEVASDFVNSCFSVSQHPLIDSTVVESQRSLLPLEQENNEEAISSDTVDELKTPKDCDALYSYMSLKTQEVVQQPETNLAGKDQVSFSSSSDISDEIRTTKRSDSFDACSYMQCWKQEAFQQSETCKDHDSFSDSSDTIDENEIPTGSNTFGVPFSYMPWWKQGTSHHPKACPTSTDHVSFAHEVASRFNNKMSNSDLHCLLERRGEEVFLTSDSHYFESAYLRISAENEVKQKMDSLEGYERNEEGLGEELSQHFEQKETGNDLVSSGVHPRSSEIQLTGNDAVPDNSVKVSEAYILSTGHVTFKMEVSGGPLQTVKSNLGETPEQLYFQEDRNQKETSTLGGKSVDATENVAFEAVIASIEPSEKESTVNEIQTDINKSLTNDSQEREPKNPDLPLSNYNDEKSLLDQLSYPLYQSTPGVFEPAPSKPLLHKKDVDDSSLYWHPNLKSHSNAQEMLKSSALLSEKSAHRQTVGFDKLQPPLIQGDIGSEPFLLIGKIKSVSALDLAEKMESLNIHPVKVSTSDSLILQGLKHQTSDEVADSSNYTFERLQGKTESDIISLDDDAECRILDEHAVVGNERAADLLREVGRSDLDINQSFSSTLPPFVPHEPTREPEYHSSDLRMLRVSPETVAKTLRHLAGDTTEGSTDEITQTNLKSGSTTTSGDSDIRSNLFLHTEDLPQLIVRSTQQKTIGQHTDIFYQQTLPDSRLSEQTLEVSAVPALANQKTGIPTVPPSSHSYRERLSTLYQQELPDSRLTVEALKALAVPGPADQNTEIARVTSSSYSHRDKPSIFYKQALSDSGLSEEAVILLAALGPDAQKIGIQTMPSGSYSQREKPTTFYQQMLPGSHLTEEALKNSPIPGRADQKTGIPEVLSSYYSQREKPSTFYQQLLSDSHLTEETLKSLPVPGPADQKTGVPTVPPSYYSYKETPDSFFQQSLPESHLTKETLKTSAVPERHNQNTGIPSVSPSSYSHRERPGTFYQQVLADGHLTEQDLRSSPVPGIPPAQKPGIQTVSSSSYSQTEKPGVLYQQTSPDSLITEEALKGLAGPGQPDQKSGIPTVPSGFYSHGEKPDTFYQQALPGSHLTEEALRSSPVPDILAAQKTGMPTVSSSSYPQREKPGVFYQQTLPDGHITEEALKGSAGPVRPDQKPGIPVVSPSSYSPRGKPGTFYQRALPDSHLTEQALRSSPVPGIPAAQETGILTVSSSSYPQREKPVVFYQQTLPDSHITEEALKGSAGPGRPDQKSGIPTVSPNSYSHREKPGTFYQQALPDGHLTEQALGSSPVPGISPGQKPGIQTVSSSSYSQREKPGVFYQETLPDSCINEQALKVSTSPGQPDQKSGIPKVPSSFHSHGEKNDSFYQQILPGSHLTGEALRSSPVPGIPAAQKTGMPIVSSSFYPQREKPGLFYQQTLPDSHITEEALKGSAGPGLPDQKSGIPAVSPSSYSHREKPGIFYQQALPDGHLTEQALKSSPVPGISPGQKPGIQTVSSSSYSQREKPGIFYQETLPDSHLNEQALKVSTGPGQSDQKSDIPTVPSSLHSHEEKTDTFYQQVLPESHLTEEALRSSPVSGIPADQKTGIPTVSSSSYPQREKFGVFYQPTLPDSYLTEEALRSSSVPGIPASQNTGILPASSSFYSQREKPGVSYQQTLPDSHLNEHALKVSAGPGQPDQKSGIPIVLSSSHSHGEKPGTFYQQALPDSHLTEQALRSSSFPGIPAAQKTGILTVSSSSYPQREKPVVFYQQTLPDSHITEEALKGSAGPGRPDQKSGIPTVSPSSYSPRGKPSTFYQQALPDSHLTEQALRSSPVPGIPASQKTGIPTVSSSSYPQREKPGVFYQQASPDSYITEEALKDSAGPGQPDQNSGIPTVHFISHSRREKPSTFYQQTLPDGHLTEQAVRSSPVPGIPTEQKTGIPTVLSSPPLHREKPGVFYQKVLPDSHLTAEALRSSPVPGMPADQKAEIPALSSGFYPHREKPDVFYQQALPDSHVTEEVLRSSPVPGIPADQQAEIPALSSSSYPQREKPGVFYQQALSDSPLIEEALKVLPVPELANQKTGIPTVSSSSYLQREKPGTFYQQELPDNHLTEEGLKSSPVLGPADQKTGIQTVPSSSYPRREKPGVFYQQALPDGHLTEEAVKVLALPGPAAQNTGIPTAPSSSYSHKEKPSTFYQQELPDHHLTEEPLEVLTVVGPADQKTGIPAVPSSSCSHKEKPGTLYQQALPDSHLTEEVLKDSPVPGPADQKTGIPTVPSTSHSHREKPGIFYQQELPDSNLTEGTLKVLAIPGPADQKPGIPTVPSSFYSQGEAPGSFCQQVLPDSHLTDESLKRSDVPGPADQKTGIRTLLPSSHSSREKPGTFYQQNFPDSHPTEEAPEVSTVPGPGDQKTGLLITPGSSSSRRVKLKISPVTGLNDRKTESPTAPASSNSQREKPKISTVIGPDDQKTPLLTVFSSSYSQRVKPSIFSQQELPDKHQIEGNLKVSTVPESTDGNIGIPTPLASSSSQTEKSHVFYLSELSDRRLTDDTPKVSAIPGPADQKTVLPTVPPSFVSHREKPNTFSQQDLPDRRVTEDSQKVSSVLGQAEQVTVLPAVPPGIYLHSEKHKVVSECAQKLIDNFNSSDLSVSSKNMPINSQVEDRVVINKPETLRFGDLGSEEIRDIDSGSKTLKEIQALLMEAENIALRRCNIPAPLIPFRDVSDISCIQSKKVVCFEEPFTTDECDGDLHQKEPLPEENPSSRCIQKDISTQTNLKCQRGIENWKFISSTTVRSPLQEAEHKARVALEETLKQYETAKSVMRSEPEGCSGTVGNKMVIPVMTIIKSDSSSDTSDGHGSCSWDGNLPESLESVSDVLLNFPDVSPNASIADSREEEGVSESDDGSSSVDSLAAHVKNLLQCESSLNHAKQILRNAEEEESRVRARAWNLKLNLAHECGYSISELNEDDRRKVEEIKAKLFGHRRTTDLSQGLQSPQGIGCKPEAVCSHIIIESHEKGCFRTLTTQQTQLDSHPCVFRSDEPEEMIREQQGPSSWRARHINLSKSLDQNNPRFKVWNSLQLRSHSPFQNFTADNFKISKDLRVPFHEKTDPWLSELVEPACVPPEEMDFHSSSQMLPPEPVKKLTTSITFSSHRHSKCISDSSVFKVGVTEGSTGAPVGVFNSHFTEEQNPIRDQKQKTSSSSSVKMCSHSPDTDRTVLAESDRQSQKLPVDFEHSHQEEKLLEVSDFKVSHSEPSPIANCSNFISMGRLSSTLGVKEKNVTITPDLPSLIFLEQRELFEQCKAPHADNHYIRKNHSPPPQHQDYVAPDLPSRIFLEQRELFEQSKASHVDYQMREYHSPIPQGQDCIALDLPCDIFLEQRELFEQSKDPCVDHHVKKHHSPFPQDQECVVEKDNQHKPKSHSSNMVNVEAKFNNTISQSFPNHCTPPSNRRALSCVRITLSPKTPSKLDSGTLDKRLHSLDSVCKSRMNREFNSELQTISSRSLEPTSESKSSLDVQVVHFPLTDCSTITQDLKIRPQNSQIVTSRQTQVNISDLEGYFNPEGTPVSADRPPEEIVTPFSAFPEKLSSDAVTQITTESPEKTSFSSEIFINTEDRERKIPESHPQQVYKVPIRFASSSSVQQITTSRGTEAQPSLLPYKPSGSTKMYYVPQLEKIPQFPDAKSDTTLESSHSGSDDAIAPDFPVQVLGTRNDDLSDTVNIKHKEGIYSKRAVTEPSWSVGKKPFQKDTAVQVSITGDEDLSDKKLTKPTSPEEKDSAGCSAAKEHSAEVQDRKIENLPDIKAIKQKEEICSKRTVPKTALTKETESLQMDTAESRCHSEFENTTHSVFRSAQFYFHHPVHLPNDQDFCHESLGRGVFMRHSWKDVFQRHPDKHKELSCLSPHCQTVDKTKMDYTRIESLRIDVNLGNKEMMHTTKSQARDHLKYNRQINDLKRDHKVTPEPTTQGTVSLNELWNRYQERQRQQKPPEFGDRKELSLVERLDRLAKLLQNPITHSLQASESTYDGSREERDVKEWSSSRQQQQKSKLQEKKRYKGLEKCRKNVGDLKKSNILSTHQAEGPNQIKFEHIKFNKYILRKQPGFNYISNTSSDSRPSEESELFTDTTTNIFSTTTSPVESEYLTQTDKEVAMHERSSSISTIDTARLIQAFGHERVCLSPRQVKLYSTITSQQRRCLEKRCKQSKKAVNTGHFHVTAEYTGRKNIQMEDQMISSDSVSSSASSFWSSSPILCGKQNVQMLNKGVQAGNLEIVNGARKHTRDVGVTFPTPSSSEARLEEDSDVSSSLSEEKHEEKRFLASYPLDKKLRKNKPNFCEGISWFVPVENLKSGPKKENLLKSYGPGISWFEPITNAKPWREPLREKNWQAQRMDCRGCLADPCRGECVHPLKPFVRASLQESLQFHRPDFISRSGERIKRLKLIVQERKLQNVLQSERDALFNTGRDCQGCQDRMCPPPRPGFLAAQKSRTIGKKEMIQRSKRMYEQLPEVQKRKEEEKRRSEYKSYRLRAQLYKKKVTNELLGRKVPWD
ncbi:centrosome-associated protein ALMS1 isoform 3-T3 [Trichechus inunguis]